MARVMIAFAVIAVIFALFFFASMERKTVIDADWRYNFDAESDQPFGLQGLTDLLVEKYQTKKIILNDFEDVRTLKGDGILIIAGIDVAITNSFGEIYSWVSNGGHAFILSESFSSSYDVVGKGLSNSMQIDTAVMANFISLKNIQIIRSDSPPVSCEVYVPNDTSLWSMKYCHYFLTLDSTTVFMPSYVTHWVDEADSNATKGKDMVISSSDNSVKAKRFDIGKGSITYASDPYIFTNIAMRSVGYLQMVNHLFDVANSGPVYVSKKQNDHVQESFFKDSPLEYILSQPMLRNAYLLVLAGLLVWLYFGVKRKQRPIPVITKIENTSLAYIRASSDLYFSQQQHDKVMAKLGELFYQYVEKRYFIHRNQLDFNIALSNKSKVEDAAIESLLKTINIKGTNGVSETRLLNAYNKLQEFYKQCK